MLIVALSFCRKGLEKGIREDEAIATAMTMLREALTKNRKPIPHLAKPGPDLISRAFATNIQYLMNNI